METQTKTQPVANGVGFKAKPEKKGGSRWKKFLRMSPYILASLVVAVFFINFFWRLSGSGTWKMIEERDGVKIYSMKVPGSYKMLFKATYDMDYHSIHQAVAGQLANSTMEVCKTLVPGCLDFQIVEPFSNSAKSDVVMWKIQLPGIFSPRENLIQSQVHQDKVTKAVRIDIMAAPNKTPMPDDGSVRTTHNHCVWTFTPLENGKLNVEYFQDISLGGFFPDLLINLTASKTMYIWIHDQLPGLLNRPGFQNIQYDFIEELESKKKDAEAWRSGAQLSLAP